MKYLTDFRKTAETGMDPRPGGIIFFICNEATLLYRTEAVLYFIPLKNKHLENGKKRLREKKKSFLTFRNASLRQVVKGHNLPFSKQRTIGYSAK